MNKFYNKLSNMSGRLAKKYRDIISGMRNFKFLSSLTSASCAAKKFLKQKLKTQQKILFPFVSVLREQQKDLTELSTCTEDEFLLLGTMLQEFSSRAKSQSEQSVLITKLFDENREASPLNLAGQVAEETLANFKMFDAEMAGATSKINSTAVKIKKLFEFKRDFNVISRTLRVLGINIKIQDAQINEESSSSVFLADKVSKLSLKTDVTVNKLFDCLKTADASIALIAGKIDKNIQKYRGQVEQTEEKINNSLGRLKKMFDLSNDLSANIALRSSEISKKIGVIVMSMQFHDISRQKTEHVAEAMEDICKKIEGEALPENAYRQHLATYISRIATVQMSQINLVAKEMENAEKKMIVSLKEIARSTAYQSEEISNTAGAGETESNDSIVVQFCNEISVIIFSLSEKAHINRRILEEVTAVSETVKKMSSFAMDVENIAESIKLLALNAQIEAEHIGENGFALGVLASELRDISAKSNFVVGEVSKGIKTILKTADGLQTRISNIFTKGIKNSEALKHRAIDAENGLHSLNREMVEHIAGLNKKSKKLAFDISALTSEIRFSQKVVERVEYVKETMHELIETAEPYHIETKTNFDEPVLDELNSRYTMESERIAHQDAFSFLPTKDGAGTNPQTKLLSDGDVSNGSHQDTETDGVELFENFDVPDEQNNDVEIFNEKKDDDDDLGDNIELF